MNKINVYRTVTSLSCQPLRNKQNITFKANSSQENDATKVTLDSNSVDKFGDRFYKACSELKGLFPYLTAKEAAALIWDRMKTDNTKVIKTELDHEV